MDANRSLFLSSSLQLAYGDWNYPYLYADSENGATRGFLHEIFHTFSDQFGLFEAARSEAEDTSKLVYFTVFSIPSLAILISLYYLALIIQYFIESLRKINDRRGVPRHFLVEICASLATALVVIGLTFAVFYHSAGFKGNSFLFTPGTVT
ncbi:hypothetical protein PFISCL1PPCAC_21837, partial [Pristionchus fissidentatus]